MNYTEIILAIISLLVAIAEAFFIPWLKTKLSADKLAKLESLVNIGVYAAEQLFTPEQWAEKKQYVQQFLADKGYKVNTTEVDAAIESAVIRLKNNLTKGVSQNEAS